MEINNNTNDILGAPEHILDIENEIQQYRIDATQKYAEKEYLLEREGVGFAPRGNVCALAAEKKAGKTWFGMAMCAAFLRGEFLGMKSRMEGGRAVFFDTEQDIGDGQRIQKRVHYACGWDFNTNNDRFQIFHLREIEATQRRDFIIRAVEYLKSDLVVVDGIRDLLSDFNDLEQSGAVIQDFMSLSSRVNCVIWAVLHVNPGSEKMRGHLGTELGNKVADIIYMTRKKDPNDESNVTYKAEETDSRGHKDITSIKFYISDNEPYGMPKLMDDMTTQDANTDELKELDELMKVACARPKSWSRTELREVVKKIKSVGTTKALTFIDQALQFNIIEMAINNKYIYRGIDSLQPNTSQEQVPF